MRTAMCSAYYVDHRMGALREQAGWDLKTQESLPFMDQHAFLAALRSEGCNVVDRTEASEQSKLGWVIDPEGNKDELWEPPLDSDPAA